MLNKNELILDKVRSLTTHDISTGQLLFRLTSMEDPSLNCTAEGEDVTDAVGAVITTLYRAKKATFSATNSLISLDLAAAQYGSTKELADNKNKFIDYTYETLEVKSGETSKKLKHTPLNKDEVLWIYSIINGEIGESYSAGATASEKEFVIAEDGTITVPTNFTGKLYVEYKYESENAVRIVNKTSKFPSVCSMVIYAYFKDKCDESRVYSGKIICPKAKLNPEQIELALTSTGKHAFEFQMMRDYCADEEDDELFTIIVSE